MKRKNPRKLKTKGHVYVATNRKDGKKYVGLTTTSLENRKFHHKRDADSGGGTSFHEAIRRDGWESFTWHIALSSQSPLELAAHERSLIKQLHTRYPDGYNHTAGGELPDYLFKYRAKNGSYGGSKRPRKRR